MSHTRRFYSDFQNQQDRIFIDGEELFHLKKVLRAKINDPVEVINGEGALALGRIHSIESEKAAVTVETFEKKPEPPVNLILAPSLLKKRAMNEMVEKLTEIGVDEIRPVIFKRSDIKSDKTGAGKWNKIAIQSLKVNHRLWRTRVVEAVTIEEILSVSRGVKTRILLDTEAEKKPDIDWISPGLVVVGPPGGILQSERELFLHNGFSPTNINDCTLKTGTAAVSIAAIIKKMILEKSA